MSLKSLCASAIALAMVASSPAFARDQIKIVGSSTVFPFSTTVAERFGKSTEFKTPVVESTGSGGGLKLFCSGVGTQHPDITNSSRRIKESEVAKCAENGVTDIVEAKIGYDGIVLANSKQADQISFTLTDVFLGLAKNVPTGVDGETQPNPYKMWNEVNPELPAIKIEVLGPPPTSGTHSLNWRWKAVAKPLIGSKHLKIATKPPLKCYAIISERTARMWTRAKTTT